VTDTKVAEGAGRVPKQGPRSRPAALRRQRPPGTRTASEKPTRRASVVKIKAGEGVRSGAPAKAAEEVPRATDTRVTKGARPVARAKAAKETGGVVKAAEGGRGRTGH
jgi:hypothetical protein